MIVSENLYPKFVESLNEVEMSSQITMSENLISNYLFDYFEALWKWADMGDMFDESWC